MRDIQLEKAISNLWSDLRGKGTDDLYSEYVRACAADNVEPRTKSVIIREACRMTECVIERKQIEVKYFLPKDDRFKDEWRDAYFKNVRIEFKVKAGE